MSHEHERKGRTMKAGSKIAAVAFGLSLALGGAGFAQTSSHTTTTEKPDGQKSSSTSTSNPATGQYNQSNTSTNPATGQSSSSSMTQHSDGSKTTTKTEKTQ
jgi:hypothetical protein